MSLECLLNDPVGEGLYGYWADDSSQKASALEGLESQGKCVTTKRSLAKQDGYKL